ncbi:MULTISPECIES: hypothetical protein [unclassified Streptomyces]|uniref:hypothetical protein n=1 Tax=unclassified Streptomyces TaxID=2593676 RepID=UPI00114C8E91|nr:hypothetical protein [Streptomyces sp. SID4945]
MLKPQAGSRIDKPAIDVKSVALARVSAGNTGHVFRGLGLIAMRVEAVAAVGAEAGPPRVEGDRGEFGKWHLMEAPPDSSIDPVTQPTSAHHPGAEATPP